MIINKLRNITIDDLYWSLRFGLPRIQKNVIDLRSNQFNDVEEPVFFLSTGRTGTMWFTKLLMENKKIRVFHRPIPDLAVQNKFVFELYNNKDVSYDLKKKIIEEILITGREQFFRYSVKTGKRYFETNNCITFFAPVIAESLPKAKFIHLYRHPGEFVRSGLRRGYYKDTAYEKYRRIEPVNNQAPPWTSFNQLQKIAWLWNETNSFIEEFKKNINPNRVLSFNFNNLNLESINSTLDFMKVSLNRSTIRKHLSKKENVQSEGKIQKYVNWDDNMKHELKQICRKLALKYNYELQ